MLSHFLDDGGVDSAGICRGELVLEECSKVFRLVNVLPVVVDKACGGSIRAWFGPSDHVPDLGWVRSVHDTVEERSFGPSYGPLHLFGEAIELGECFDNVLCEVTNFLMPVRRGCLAWLGVLGLPVSSLLDEAAAPRAGCADVAYQEAALSAPP